MKNFLFLFLFTSSWAAETDQFTVLDKSLKDSLDNANKWVNLILDQTLDEKNKQHPSTCHELRQSIFEHIDQYRIKTNFYWDNFHRETYPEKSRNMREYLRKETIYRDVTKFDLGFIFGPILPGAKVEPRKLITPSINIDGINLGLDKIAHFFILGYKYYELYQDKILKSGQSEEKENLDQASVKYILDFGINDEKGKHGLALIAFAYGDLDANFRGFLFYKELCDQKDPYLTNEKGIWERKKDFDWRKYQSPHWDESYQMAAYKEQAWNNKIKKNVLLHCSKLQLPQVQERFKHYDSILKRSIAIDYTLLQAQTDKEIPIAHNFRNECGL